MVSASTLLDRRLVEFNQLPSRTLHPSRHAAYAPRPALALVAAAPALAPAWHRHWSREILETLGLRQRPVTDPDHPELALALLAPDAMMRCARQLGTVLCGPRLRRAIAGDEVRALIADLGGDLLAFSRRTAASLHGGLADSVAWTLADTTAAIDSLGLGALRAAWSGAGPELARRAELKLPDVATPAPPLPAPQALTLGLSLLKQTDPTWLSSFPAIR
ncbi:SctK family type III secretion system sorting platform protein [Achromobacter xylosoxidans]|uniref:SctK family type III secretion system sorting platform protein n=1 Tax=Alcaligenes xylosoxydans xylosoxydans TaxID=85698 RepID=UPI0006C5DCF3|nr:SctK family type III secretion system sorting platform protein [Achromobacter xylosoxidans]MCH4571374.1 SctK family type III secretion system sorting platform protein [Achromobacter xylosoxidans]MDD7990667.1 SctK family type III secretion system sorting platform protein [Achromobacter xylosoxidans]NEV05538.1 YscK family type III secretion system sorting platform protein [Achromobacter xylosoxidans]OFO57144.1 hypothetical protein HMPREF3024_06425 [Achromobacter xylosoxidans]OMG85262.1 hypoth